jgi:hypothetical protein
MVYLDGHLAVWPSFFNVNRQTKAVTLKNKKPAEVSEAVAQWSCPGDKLRAHSECAMDAPPSFFYEVTLVIALSCVVWKFILSRGQQ